MRFHHRSCTIVAAVALTGAASCAHHTPAPVAAAAPMSADAGAASRARATADSLTRAEALRHAADARAMAARNDSIRAARERALASARSMLEAGIRFDYDSDALSDAARATLDAKLGALTANEQVHIRVAGSTDERGSDEYNLALGQRRAAAAKRYLTQHGIADARIDLISYGEERPVADGHDEGAWAQNRRDAFEITAGTVTAAGISP